MVTARPVLPNSLAGAAPYRDLCTDCGLSRASEPSRCVPRGQEFARARIEMKAIEGVVNVRAERPRRMRRLVSAHAWRLAAPYAVTPLEGERPLGTTTLRPAARPARPVRS